MNTVAVLFVVNPEQCCPQDGCFGVEPYPTSTRSNILAFNSLSVLLFCRALVVEHGTLDHYAFRVQFPQPSTLLLSCFSLLMSALVTCFDTSTHNAHKNPKTKAYPPPQLPGEIITRIARYCDVQTLVILLEDPLLCPFLRTPTWTRRLSMGAREVLMHRHDDPHPLESGEETVSGITGYYPVSELSVVYPPDDQLAELRNPYQMITRDEEDNHSKRRTILQPPTFLAGGKYALSMMLMRQMGREATQLITSTTNTKWIITLENTKMSRVGELRSANLLDIPSSSLSNVICFRFPKVTELSRIEAFDMCNGTSQNRIEFNNVTHISLLWSRSTTAGSHFKLGKHGQVFTPSLVSLDITVMRSFNVVPNIANDLLKRFKGEKLQRLTFDTEDDTIRVGSPLQIEAGAIVALFPRLQELIIKGRQFDFICLQDNVTDCKLKLLTLAGCSMSGVYTTLQLTNLEEAHLINVGRINSIGFLEQCPKLKKLTVGQCDDLFDISWITLKELEEFSLKMIQPTQGNLTFRDVHLPKVKKIELIAKAREISIINFCTSLLDVNYDGYQVTVDKFSNLETWKFMSC